MHATAAEITGIGKIRSAEHVRDALARANTDANARAFLATALSDLRHANAELFPPSASTKAATSTVPRIVPPGSGPLVVPAPVNWRFPRGHFTPALATTAIRHGSNSPFVPVCVAPPLSGASQVAANAKASGPAQGLCYVYGTTAALKWSAGTNRNSQAVVALDVAPATKAQTYDWNSKITAVLDPNELLMALAVLLGDSPGVTLHHAADSEDHYTQISHSGTHAFVTIRRGEIVRFARMEPPDAYNVAVLLVAQVRANTPSGAQADVVTLAREIVGRMVKQSACRAVTYQRPDPVPAQWR